MRDFVHWALLGDDTPVWVTVTAVFASWVCGVVYVAAIAILLDSNYWPLGLVLLLGWPAFLLREAFKIYLAQNKNRT